MEYRNTLDFAFEMDRKDPLKKFREQFHIPKNAGKDAIYFTGNSLGLQPKNVSEFINEELRSWQNLGVEGHFEGQRPWLHYHKLFKQPLSELTGALPGEVVSMNNLTSNLHFLFASFYRPTKKRYKIIMEKGAFPSDQYVVETQVIFHGFDPEDSIIEVEGQNNYISLENIENTIREHGDRAALVFFSGVQYYTGQWFNLKEISKMAHAAGAYAGFDLAHAAGNIPLRLHNDEVDFATWCSYKYLNSGPGNVSGIFIHEKHGNNPDVLRLGGWWGHDEESRFLMKKGFQPMPGADGWQLSNVNIISSAAHLASLNIFKEAGMANLREKSEKLTGFLEYALKDALHDRIGIITPANPEERGCQLSIVIKQEQGRRIHERLTKNGIFVDWREPDVIRAAPVPLYNTFVDIYRFVEILNAVLDDA